VLRIYSEYLNFTDSSVVHFCSPVNGLNPFD
jgi:hypothetical protein